MILHRRPPSYRLPLLFGIAIAVTASGCGNKGPRGPQGPPPLAVDIGKATQQDIGTFLSLDGQVAPLQESTLSLSQSGTLVRVNVTEGQHVRAGETLAQIDDSTLRAQLAANEALVNQASARLQGSSIQQPIQSQQYNSAASNAKQAVDQAQNRVTSSQASLKNAELVYKSNRQLFAQGYVSQTVLEQARSAYVAAQQDVNNARSGLAQAQFSLRTAQTNTQQGGVDAQTVEGNRAALKQAQANVQLLRTQIAQTTLSAPYDGVITQRFLDPGAFASPNTPICKLSQISTVYVNINVPDSDLGVVRGGTPVSFTTTSLPGQTFRGGVAEVNATPTQGTLSYRARLRVPNEEGRLRGGMLVSVAVRKEFHKGAVVVPRTAVFQNDQGASVFTVVDGKAKAIPVKVGIQTDTQSEVLGSAVVPGTVVITTRPDALQDGSVVAVGGPGGPGGPAPGGGRGGSPAPGRPAASPAARPQ